MGREQENLPSEWRENRRIVSAFKPCNHCESVGYINVHTLYLSALVDAATVSDKKLDCVKHIREKYGVGLLVAKQTVEEVWNFYDAMYDIWQQTKHLQEGK